MDTNVLTAVGLLLAAGALFYQARAYQLSRRELSVKIHDLSEIVHRLEDEIRERESLARQYNHVRAEGLDAHADSLNHASHLGDIHLNTIRALEAGIDGALSDIQHVLLGMTVSIRRTLDPRHVDCVKLLDATAVLCQIRLDHMTLAAKWRDELAAIDQRFPAELYQDPLRAVEERVAFITRETARIEGKYAEPTDALNAQLWAAQEHFLELLRTNSVG